MPPMSFFTFVSSLTQTNAYIESDANVAQVDKSNNRALVVYNPDNTTRKDDRSMHETRTSSTKRPGTPHDNDSTTPFTPSKRQYREVDESISLREKNRVMEATNKKLIQQQAILTQRAEEASQFAREAEETARAARQVQKQLESDLKTMQLAQEKFQQEMAEKCQSYFAKITADKENEMATMAKQYEETVTEKCQSYFAKLTADKENEMAAMARRYKQTTQRASQQAASAPVTSPSQATTNHPQVSTNDSQTSNDPQAPNDPQTSNDPQPTNSAGHRSGPSMQTKSITSRIKELKKSHIRVRPRTILKLREEPIVNEPIVEEGPTMVHEPTTLSSSGNKGFNMKELAKELAPLVASAMRNCDNDHKEEKRSRSTKKKSRDERDGETEEERMAFLYWTRELYKHYLKIEEDLDFAFHEPPSTEQLRAFANDPTKGPTLEDAHFDVKAGMLSEWNKNLLLLLQVTFQQELPGICAQQGLTLPVRTDKYYGNLVSERFQRLAAIWKQGQPKTTTGGVLESYEKAEERMASTRKLTAKKQRHLSRRLYRFNGRVAIVERVISVKAADKDRDGDLRVWKWLLELLQRYGSDGMSSDDTDTGDIGTIYRVKILVWRRNVDKYVQMIDNERKMSADIFSASGAKSVTRVRSPKNLESVRQPPTELPATLFDPDWLEEVDKDYRRITLAVSEEEFHWIEFQPEQLGEV